MTTDPGRLQPPARPWVQIAIDVRSIPAALDLVDLSVSAGADWIEVGTPLITYEGVRAIEAVAGVAHGRPVVADFKAQDGVGKYFLEARRRGASFATVLGVVPDAAIAAAVTARDRDGGCGVIVDLYGVRDLAQRARQVEALGVDFVMLHLGFDEARAHPERDPLEGLDEVVAAVGIPVGVGTFTVGHAIDAVRRGASWVVQGEPILSDEHAHERLVEYVGAVHDARRHSPDQD